MNILPALRDHLQVKIPGQKWDLIGVIGGPDDPTLLLGSVGLSGYMTIEQKDNVIRISLRGPGVFDSLEYRFNIDLQDPHCLAKIRVAVRKCIQAESIDHELRQLEEQS